jgi:hypothetical protein
MRKKASTQFWKKVKTMTTPTTDQFDSLESDVGLALFDMALAGRCTSSAHVTGIRWFMERDTQPGWLISIMGLGHDAPMELNYIAAYLGERDYDVTNIEIILEAEE